ncbi:MAG: hypothetical protein R3292_04010 [Alcanivorax sp.]|nr:hypothetical protein [Alcanivorax sp.]
MSEQRYHVVFSGELVAGADPETVKANLARLFKMDAARVDKLFSGQPVVLKKNADQATAMKFRAVLKQAGAVCEMRALESGSPQPSGQPASPPVAASQPAPAPAQAPEAQPDGDLETVGTIRTGGTGFSGPFTVAEAGADMDNSEHEAPPPAPDISHLSMGNPGEDLGQLKKEQTTDVPDISHLSIAKDQ